ncbi:uncharacterized protein LOC116413202 [Galleria mellonella]|uniref:Odorant-binding protein n=1 Tax=Galleria mellonella TaxID=7137 RepID=A0A5C0E5W1_GALME|nr:uncharacterized protein LOC116413202 [Galleria mellonella]QEI46787.1 odorant-binding protein 3 [Galleria mellonella]QID58970.1 odorant-binding protein [Galleria mellonella]
MKVLYTVSVVIVLKLTAAITLHEHITIIQPKLTNHADDCLEEYPLSTEDLAAFKNGEFPEGSDAACLGACVLKKIGLFDDLGSLVKDAALDKAKEIFTGEGEMDAITDIITKCAKINDEVTEDGEKGCERARLLFNCLNEIK